MVGTVARPVQGLAPWSAPRSANPWLSLVAGHRPSALWLPGLTLFCLLATSCAYYNTYYLARKYYDRATNGQPYEVNKPTGASLNNYGKAVDYSKKVLGLYPKSKWVDDAYLMWARGVIGQQDPIQAVNLLRDFPSRFPNSPLKRDAVFYLGVAYRQSRKYNEAVGAFDQFLTMGSKNALTPYAHLERARALMSLDRPADAAAAADALLKGWPRHALRDDALQARADALFESHDFERARADFRQLETRARTDDERFTNLLRESDCFEGARQFEAALTLLRGALSHETPPIPGVQAFSGSPGGDRYGRLEIRIGSVYLQDGKLQPALDSYRHAIQDFPKSPVSAEAQYRIGFAYETLGDDFEKARAEYARVREEFASSAFVTQAQQRQTNLDRVAQYRTAGGAGADSTAKRAEAGFLLAELYLFQLDKPERALEEYRKVSSKFAGTPMAGKALNAEAWVLRRKFDRIRESDSLLWKVVREYPATEAQLAARDYLELSGTMVPPELIKYPEKPAGPDTTMRLTPPPTGPTSLSPRPPGMAFGDSLAGALDPRRRLMTPGLMPPDRRFVPGRPDSLVPAPAPAPVPPDTARRDTSKGRP